MIHDRALTTVACSYIRRVGTSSTEQPVLRRVGVFMASADGAGAMEGVSTVTPNAPTEGNAAAVTQQDTKVDTSLAPAPVAEVERKETKGKERDAGGRFAAGEAGKKLTPKAVDTPVTAQAAPEPEQAAVNINSDMDRVAMASAMAQITRDGAQAVSVRDTKINDMQTENEALKERLMAFEQDAATAAAAKVVAEKEAMEKQLQSLIERGFAKEGLICGIRNLGEKDYAGAMAMVQVRRLNV